MQQGVDIPHPRTAQVDRVMRVQYADSKNERSFQQGLEFQDYVMKWLFQHYILFADGDGRSAVYLCA